MVKPRVKVVHGRSEGRTWAEEGYCNLAQNLAWSSFAILVNKEGYQDPLLWPCRKGGMAAQRERQVLSLVLNSGGFIIADLF